MSLLKRSSTILLAAAALILAACECNTPDEDDIGELVDEWYLSGDDTLDPRLGHLVDLAGALGDAGLTVTYPEDMAYRLGWAGDEEEYWERIARADANLAGYLHDVGPYYPGEEGISLLTHAGLDSDSLEVEVASSKAWLEDLIGTSVLSYAYPTHAHDRRALEAVKAAGYIVARNGPISFEPWGSWLLGEADDPAWAQGWERTSPYELPLTFTAGEIQSLAVSEIEDWLADPANLEAWKTDHRWVHLYTRTDSEDQTSLDILDQDHLEALIDALHEDSEVWIASMGEIATWALASGQEVDPENDLLWRADPAGDAPWNGYKCAFTFSTDDGFRSNLTHYTPVFTSRNLSYTVFVSQEKIAIGENNDLYLDDDDVLSLQSQGIEIGCNGMSRRYLLPQEALHVSDSTGEGFQIEILVEDGNKLLRLWRDW